LAPGYWRHRAVTLAESPVLTYLLRREQVLGAGEPIPDPRWVG
jgi:hypothetical protein